MTKEIITEKKPKVARTLEDEINATREKLKRLENQHKEQIRKEREKNQREVLELIKLEKLDSVPSSKWKTAMPQIKLLLVEKLAEEPVSKKTENTLETAESGKETPN